MGLVCRVIRQDSEVANGRKGVWLGVGREKIGIVLASAAIGFVDHSTDV